MALKPNSTLPNALNNQATGTGAGPLDVKILVDDLNDIPTNERYVGMKAQLTTEMAATPWKYYHWNGATWDTVDLSSGGGVTDHGALTGLTDDDHDSLYLLNWDNVLIVHKSPGATRNDHYFSTVSSALFAASDGDTILVMPGDYNEIVDFSSFAQTDKSVAIVGLAKELVTISKLQIVSTAGITVTFANFKTDSHDISSTAVGLYAQNCIVRAYNCDFYAEMDTNDDNAAAIFISRDCDMLLNNCNITSVIPGTSTYSARGLFVSYSASGPVNFRMEGGSIETSTNQPVYADIDPDYLSNVNIELAPDVNVIMDPDNENRGTEYGLFGWGAKYVPDRMPVDVKNANSVVVTFDDGTLGDWEIPAGTPPYDHYYQLTGGAPGGRKIQFVSNGQSGEAIRLLHKTLVPYDADKTYRITGIIRQDTAATVGTNRVYVGVVGVARDGVTLVNRNGDNSVGSAHYYAARNANPTVGEFIKYTGYISGHSATIADATYPNPGEPGPMHEDVRYLRIYVILNYTGSNGIVDLCHAELTSIDYDVAVTGPVGDKPLRMGPEGQIKTAHKSSGYIAFHNTDEANLNAITATSQCMAADVPYEGRALHLRINAIVRTTNNASNYWELKLRKWQGNSTVLTESTATHSANVWIVYEREFTHDLTGIDFLTILAQKYGAPGQLEIRGASYFLE